MGATVNSLSGGGTQAGDAGVAVSLMFRPFADSGLGVEH
jgi:hypothetical protein